jgi:hypothetical protein
VNEIVLALAMPFDLARRFVEEGGLAMADVTGAEWIINDSVQGTL